MLRGYAAAATILAFASPALAQAVARDATAAVSALASPRESRAGWHTSPVTLTFFCGNTVPAGTCHEPVVFSSDGAEQILRMTTRDESGHDIESSFVVSVDATPPSVAIRAPLEGLTTIDETVAVTASVSDATSGLIKVMCNGIPAVLAGTVARCVVPLAIGLNAVVVHAMDVAGNSASAGARVIREVPTGGFTLFPHAVTTTVGSTDVVKLLTDAGTDPSGVTWRSTESTIMSVDPYGAYAQLASKAPGEATITARSAGRTALATASFVKAVADRFPAGTTVWSVAPTAGLIAQAPIEGRRADRSPDLFTVDADPSGRFTIVRALTSRGIPLWIGAVPGIPLFGDRFGGLIARLGSLEGPSHTIGRFDNERNPVWRFEALGEITDVAQTEDGVIYLVEHLVESPTASRTGRDEMNIVAVNGRTGLAIARWGIGQGDVSLGPLFVDADRAVYAQMLDGDTMVLLRATTNGVESVGTLWKRERRESFVRPGPVVVNGRLWVHPGVHLAFWTEISGPVSRLHITRIGYGGAVSEVVRERRIPAAPIRALVEAFDERMLYLADGSTLEAIDVASGVSQWTMKTSAIPIVVLDHDRLHVVVNDVSAGRVLELDEKGEVVDSFAAHINHALTDYGGDYLILGGDPTTGATVQVAFPEHINPDSGWFTTLTIR